jgi:[ribosomal protein S5]-alanine N-acetyltransferase
MTSSPTLQSERLRIRPYSKADIPELVRLIGTREVAATTLRIAHPYSEQDARAFLELAKEPDKLWLAITLRADGRQIGGIGLRVELQHQHAELGYWLGVSYWSQGATRRRRRAKCCATDLKTLPCTAFSHRISNTILRPEKFSRS